ncbi:MAG TPA: hypothetical protein VF132_11250, partial [Rudaea sp.]
MRILPLAILLCVLPLAARADFRAEFDSARGADDGRALSRIELSGQKMRTDAGGTSVLFDVRSAKMYVLLHDKKQYMDMDKIAQQVGAAMAQANAALANLPPEQRAMIEKQMGAHLPGGGGRALVKMTPTGASDRVAGYACQVYRTEINGEYEQDSCLANLSDAGISAADQATVRAAFQQMKALSEKMSAGTFRSPMADMPLDKFPVR